LGQECLGYNEDSKRARLFDFHHETKAEG
jgi:hypothetical protein